MKLFLVFALAYWGAGFGVLFALYYFATAFGRVGPSRGSARRAGIRSLFLAALCALVAGAAPHAAIGFAFPVFWPIWPFELWAAVACLIAAIWCLMKFVIERVPGQRSSGRAVAEATALHIVLWLLLAWLFYFWFRRSADPTALATGSIQLTVASALALVVLALITVAAMAASERAVRSMKIFRPVAIHAALLAGCVVFGLPFLWLLITSFKEADDMASPTGLVWVPRVTETVSTYDAVPPLYQSSFNGRGVNVNIITQGSDGIDDVEIISPEGMQGRIFNAPASSLKRVPTQAKVVTGPYEGQEVAGYVIQDYDDGRQKVRITLPATLKDREFIGLPKDLKPVRHVGLRWQNYSEALGYLPPEADDGLVYLRNTLLIAILSVIGTVLSSSVVAYGFSRLRFPGRDPLFGVMLSTMMLPGAVTLLPRFIIFRDLGWIDTLLPLWAPAFFASAFNVFLLRQFFKNVPVELEDAAKIDGCTYLRSYWSVMMPQVKPALAVISIWTFMGAWNDFMGPLIYLNSPQNLTITYGVQIFATDHSAEPGLMMAFATMSIIPVVLLFFFGQRYFIEGVSLSGFGGK